MLCELENRIRTAGVAICMATMLVFRTLAATPSYETNCFEIVSGDYPTLVYSTNRAVCFELRSYGSNGWYAVQSSMRGSAYIADKAYGETVYSGDFKSKNTALDSSAINPPEIFRFAFYWSLTLESGTTLELYGWVSLTMDENGNPYVLACEVSDTSGIVIVGRGEPGYGDINPVTGCETNCFHIVPGSLPHIAYNYDTALDFAVDFCKEACWEVSVHHSSGWGYITDTSSGTVVNDPTFSSHAYKAYGEGETFHAAFYWRPEDGDPVRNPRYGWFTLGFVDGELSILGSEITEEANTAIVGRGFPAADDGEEKEERIEGLIWRCNFNKGANGMDARNLPDAADHIVLSDEYPSAMIDDGSKSGRICVDVGGYGKDRTWFTINESPNGWINGYRTLDKWEKLTTSLKLHTKIGCWENEEPYGTFNIVEETKLSGLLGLIRLYGSTINIDDKISLRYREDSDNGYKIHFWQLHASWVDESGEKLTQSIVLKAEDGDRYGLSSPMDDWVTVSIESINDCSPLGLAHRIYIDGILACSEEDGTSVFRSRPEASARDGVAALGIGGNAYVDDVIFSSVSIKPLAGVEIQPTRFDPANAELTEDELDVLANMIGLDAFGSLQYVSIYPWDSEPEDSPKTCLSLGIGPCVRKWGSDKKEDLTLFFKEPDAVEVVAIDPAEASVSGRIVPAEGTKIINSPQRYMFGIDQFVDFGTPYQHTEEYGYTIVHDDEKFHLDTSCYAVSNGMFKISFANDHAEPGSTFFSLRIKDYRFW